MSPIHIALLSLVSVLGGAALGIFVRALLPQDHLSADTKDTVKLAMGLVATMTALVLGLLVASAKGSYDAQRNQLIQMAAKFAFLDRVLANCGPDAPEARAQLRMSVEQMIARILAGRQIQASRTGAHHFRRAGNVSGHPKTVAANRRAACGEIPGLADHR